MSFRSARVVVFALAVTAAAATVHGAAATRQQADSLARKITQITQRGGQTATPTAVRRTEVSEDEVNSWFVYRGQPYLPDGVTNPSITMMGDGTMRGAVTVDLESVGKKKSSGGGLNPLSYLGKVPVEVTGTLRAHDGRGQFEMKSAEVAGVPVPKAIVQQLLSYYASSPDDKKPISLDASFELPAKIRSIDVGRGQLVVVQ
jgi:hypothetical protein